LAQPDDLRGRPCRSGSRAEGQFGQQRTAIRERLSDASCVRGSDDSIDNRTVVIDASRQVTKYAYEVRDQLGEADQSTNF
jgi:hypothetical protein